MKAYIFIQLFIFSSILSFAQSTDWNVILKDNNVHKQSKNTQDFRFLDSLVKDKRIVMLGERRHDHGASRSTISKMIRYLHENCGFNTLVLEHGIHKIEYFRASLKDNMSYTEFIDYNLSGYYNFNDHNLYKCIHKKYHTSNRLDVFGGDVHLLNSSTKNSAQQFKNRFEHQIINKYTLSDSLQTQWKYLKENMFNIPYNRLLSNTYKKKFDSFSDQLLKVDTNIRHSLEYVMFRNHVYSEWAVNNTRGNPEFKKKYPAGSMDWGKTRDSLLALTLDWMLTYGPLKDKKKIIVTFSAWHIADNLSSIGKEIDAIDYAIPMKELLPSKYDSQIYSIAFVSYAGYRGDQLIQGYRYGPTKILPEKCFLRSKGIENQLVKKGFEEGFVDFSNVNKLYKFYMSPTFKDKEYLFNWANVYSGIYFIKNQEPIYMLNSSMDNEQLLEAAYKKWKKYKMPKYFD